MTMRHKAIAKEIDSYLSKKCKKKPCIHKRIACYVKDKIKSIARISREHDEDILKSASNFSVTVIHSENVGQKLKRITKKLVNKKEAETEINGELREH